MKKVTLKKEILISKELQVKIKDVMRAARHDAIDMEPNEGVDAYYDGMRDLGFTEESARMLMAYSANTQYVEGRPKVRIEMKPGWLPVLRPR